MIEVLVAELVELGDEMEGCEEETAQQRAERLAAFAMADKFMDELSAAKMSMGGVMNVVLGMGLGMLLAADTSMRPLIYLEFCSSLMRLASEAGEDDGKPTAH